MANPISLVRSPPLEPGTAHVGTVRVPWATSLAFFVTITLLAACGEPAVPPPPQAQVEEVQSAIVSPAPRVYVWRAGRTLFLLDRFGQVQHREPVGIGRGGLGEKVAMSDEVTPTGTFTVDLVLHRAGTHDAVATGVVDRFAGDPAYLRLLTGNSPGLPGLFANMNGLDFDADGRPDGAYGGAYIGLDGPQSGPKMRRHRASGTPYWFSIALHGTPDPARLGAATSGGCVHVSESLLERLVTEGIIRVGSTVEIADVAP